MKRREVETRGEEKERTRRGEKTKKRREDKEEKRRQSRARNTIQDMMRWKKDKIIEERLIIVFEETLRNRPTSYK